MDGVTDDLVKRENKKNYLHLIDMAKNKTILQMLGSTEGESEITFASQCIFTWQDRNISTWQDRNKP